MIFHLTFQTNLIFGSRIGQCSVEPKTFIEKTTKIFFTIKIHFYEIIFHLKFEGFGF